MSTALATQSRHGLRGRLQPLAREFYTMLHGPRGRRVRAAHPAFILRTSSVDWRLKGESCCWPSIQLRLPGIQPKHGRHHGASR